MPAHAHSRGTYADLDFATILDSLSDLSLCEAISQPELDYLVEGIEELGLRQEIPEGEMSKLLGILGELCIRVSKPAPPDPAPTAPEPRAHGTPHADATPPASAPKQAVAPVKPIPPPQNVDMTAADEIRHHLWAAHQAVPDPATVAWPNPCNCGTRVIMPDKPAVCWHTLTYSWVCPYCLLAFRLNMGRGEHETAKRPYVFLSDVRLSR